MVVVASSAMSQPLLSSFTQDTFEEYEDGQGGLMDSAQRAAVDKVGLTNKVRLSHQMLT